MRIGTHIYRECEGRSAVRRIFSRRAATSDRRGFTLVEMSTSVAVLLVVLTAAWLLLTASNDNLNRIDYGGQTSELNRAALAWFERDINHAVLPVADVSPILDAQARHCSILVDDDSDGNRELVTWEADVQHGTLQRVVTRPATETPAPVALADFDDGVSTTTTVLTGLDWGQVPGSPLQSSAMFSYRPSAKADYAGDKTTIGLVTFHLRNGLPTTTDNVTDRTAAFRVTAYVINGYVTNGD